MYNGQVTVSSYTFVIFPGKSPRAAVVRWEAHDGAMDTDAQLAGRERLDEIVSDRLADAAVDQGRMFSTVG